MNKEFKKRRCLSTGDILKYITCWENWEIFNKSFISSKKKKKQTPQENSFFPKTNFSKESPVGLHYMIKNLKNSALRLN